MSQILQVIKWILVVIGISNVFFYLSPRIISADFFRIGKELKSLEYLSAYQFSVYDGELQNSQIWLKNKGYILSENIRLESFNNPSADVIYQIGRNRLYCLSDDPKKRPLDGYEPFATVVQLSAALDNRYNRSLADFLKDYSAFEQMVSSWPNSRDSAIELILDEERLDNAGVETIYYTSMCWKNIKSRPPLPLEPNLSFHKNGVWFFRRNVSVSSPT